MKSEVFFVVAIIISGMLALFGIPMGLRGLRTPGDWVMRYLSGHLARPSIGGLVFTQIVVDFVFWNVVLWLIYWRVRRNSQGHGN